MGYISKSRVILVRVLVQVVIICIHALSSHAMCFILSQRDTMLNSIAVSDG